MEEPREARAGGLGPPAQPLRAAALLSTSLAGAGEPEHKERESRSTRSGRAGALPPSRSAQPPC
jgi:hypothetical protein